MSKFHHPYHHHLSSNISIRKWLRTSESQINRFYDKKSQPYHQRLPALMVTFEKVVICHPLCRNLHVRNVEVIVFVTECCNIRLDMFFLAVDWIKFYPGKILLFFSENWLVPSLLATVGFFQAHACNVCSARPWTHY